MAGQKVTETGVSEEARAKTGRWVERLGPGAQVGESSSAEEDDATLLEALDLISDSMEAHAERWKLLLDNVEDSLVEMGAQRDLVAPDPA